MSVAKGISTISFPNDVLTSIQYLTQYFGGIDIGLNYHLAVTGSDRVRIRSSNPSIVSVNEFNQIIKHNIGMVTITVEA